MILDIYGSEEFPYVYGENGDYTGSPYGYPPTEYTLPAADTLPPAVAPVMQVDAEKKPWYDVLAQLGGSAAGVISALKGTGPGGTVVNSTDPTAVVGSYQGATGNPPPADKKDNTWLWVAIAMVVVLLLAFFAFRKVEN